VGGTAILVKDKASSKVLQNNGQKNLAELILILNKKYAIENYFKLIK
jgi:hypothetical protein